ncbi:MAG: Rrf2 family transcriptional regulator [Elusimicrobia bacterium]|nr:Rrf2 family transcriptional regulator [Elusimicrobiota bacterium]
MDGCLKLSLAGRYALSFAVALVWKFPKSEKKTIPFFCLGDLAEEQHIPAPFLAKIIQPLVKKGLILSKKGKNGGVRLNRHPEDISTLEIVETCEGSYERSNCIFYPETPCAGKKCSLFCPLRKIEEKLRLELKNISLEELACSLKAHPRRG